MNQHLWWRGLGAAIVLLLVFSGGQLLLVRGGVYQRADTRSALTADYGPWAGVLNPLLNGDQIVEALLADEQAEEASLTPPPPLEAVWPTATFAPPTATLTASPAPTVTSSPVPIQEASSTPAPSDTPPPLTEVPTATHTHTPPAPTTTRTRAPLPSATATFTLEPPTATPAPLPTDPPNTTPTQAPPAN